MNHFANALKKIFPFLFVDWEALGKPSSVTEQALKQKLEVLVGRNIETLSYYITALTHRSAIEMAPTGVHLLMGSNERLEFLGDAVLDLIVAEFLYKNYESSDEGQLTKLRSQLVNWKSLSDFARQIGLNELLIVSDGARQMGVQQSDTALADAAEAVIGAVYLDFGYDAAYAFVVEKLLKQTDFKKLIAQDDNYKSALLELAQAKKIPVPVYNVIEEEGPAHKKIFTIVAKIGERIMGEGKGNSKKIAEQFAAQEALEKLKAESLVELKKD